MTRTIITFAALAMGVVALGSAAHSASAVQKPSMSNQVLKKSPTTATQLLSMNCVAQGTPVEFPDDIIIRNTGKSSIPNGTKVAWKMVGVNSQGTFVLPALAPNKHVFIGHANPGGLPAGTPCTVKIIK